MFCFIWQLPLILELPLYTGIGLVTGICISDKYCCKIYSDNASVIGVSVKAIFADAYDKVLKIRTRYMNFGKKSNVTISDIFN